MTCDELIKAIQDNLTDDLLKPEYRGHHNKFYGHCYVASEALYHLTDRRYHPKCGKDSNNVNHWWLEDDDGNILDVTAKQYTDDGQSPPYNKRKSLGFLTKRPSKRAQTLMDRL